MRNDFETGYLEHSLSGWVKKNHKYIKRVWKNGKWRYYYNKVKSTVSKVVKKASTSLSELKITKKAKELVEKTVEDNASMTMESIGRKLKKITQKNYKYYKKIKLSNGKYRYFYSEAEYNRYLKRNNLDKDYDFMQDVPALDKKKTPEQIAKDADVGTDLGNCSTCAMAFELQMRGYDVKSRKDLDGASPDDYLESFKDFFEGIDGPTTKFNYYFSQSKERNKGYYGKGFLGLKSTTEEEKLEIVKNDLNATVIERGGENQRGFITISWTQTDPDENGERHKSGGSHVFNYVVENGEVKYYDAQKGESNNQTGGEIDITEYLDNTNYMANQPGIDGGSVTYMAIFRVDDKDLTETAKDYVSYTPEDNTPHYEPEVEEYEIYVMDVPLSLDEEKKKNG